MDAAAMTPERSAQRRDGRAVRPFQVFVDTYPDVKKRPLHRLPVTTDVCWLEDSQGTHRVALRPDDWRRLPADGLLLAARGQGRVYVLALQEDRVIAAVPVVGAFGADTIPWV